jgi:DNA-binding CsgD family transcriptional regulator
MKMSIIDNYSLFFEFIETFISGGFLNVDTDSSIVRKIEQMMAANNQFFFVGDLILFRILYTSKRCMEMIGVEPANLDTLVMFAKTHPEDIDRHNVGRTKLFNFGHQVFVDKGKPSLLSSNFRFENASGGFTNTLIQCYVFYSEIPYKTSFVVQIMTDISWFKKINHGYHFYVGNDLSLFRYPDEDILLKGRIFTDTEFRILKLIASGSTTEEAAERLFLSPHTISTHRRNILKKTKKKTTNELISELKASGFL